MCCRSADLGTASLVDADIDDDGSGFHQREILFCDQLRGSRTFDEHGSDDQVRLTKLLADGVSIAEQRVDIRRHDVFQVAEPVDADVKNGDVRLKAGRNLSRVLANDSAAQHDDMSRQHSGNSAE